jgi:hypothetical protein
VGAPLASSLASAPSALSARRIGMLQGGLLTLSVFGGGFSTRSSASSTRSSSTSPTAQTRASSPSPTGATSRTY